MSKNDDDNSLKKTFFGPFKDLPPELQEILIKEQASRIDPSIYLELAKLKLEKDNPEYNYWKDVDGRWQTT